MKSDRKYYLLQILNGYGYNIIESKSISHDERYKVKLSKLTNKKDDEEENELKLKLMIEMEKEMKIIEENKEKRSALEDVISSITFTTLESDVMMKKTLKSRKNVKLEGISENDKVKSREDRVRILIGKGKENELSDFERSFVENDKKLMNHLNIRNLLMEEREFELKYEREYKSEFKEEYKSNELLKMRLLKSLMKLLNVSLNDINVLIISRYDSNVDDSDMLSRLKDVICRTFRLKNVGNKFKDNYYMLITMLDSSCGIISNIKQKYINATDRVGYYELNSDYKEHKKIIDRVGEVYNES